MNNRNRRRVRQVENKESGIFHIVNISETDDPGKSPGGYFIEKSRKTELYRIQQKKEQEETKQISEKSWFQKLKDWIFG